MPKRPKRPKYTPPEDKRGTRCSICGQVFTVPKGYSYYPELDSSYDDENHPFATDCIKYLRDELKEAKSELTEVKSDVRELVRILRDNQREYH